MNQVGYSHFIHVWLALSLIFAPVASLENLPAPSVMQRAGLLPKEAPLYGDGSGDRLFIEWSDSSAVLAFAPNVLKTHLNFSQETYTLIFNLETITQ